MQEIKPKGKNKVVAMLLEWESKKWKNEYENEHQKIIRCLEN